MYFGHTLVQRDLSFHIAPASVFMIMGVSGCGKSTLLRHMIDLQRASQGRIMFDGQSLTDGDVQKRNAIQDRIGVLFQNSALWSSMTLAENVALPLQLHTKLRPAEIDDQVAFKLALVGLDGRQNRMPNELSGGMRKRAGLARAMALDPSYLFLDEPSAGLDPNTSQQLDGLILKLRDALGVTVVAVSHELPSIFAIADDSIYLDNVEKTAIAHGKPGELVENAAPNRVRAFLTRTPVVEEATDGE
ncbi:ATP-binding cassette domain-containing protein [Salinisphaera sp. USBA-960]|nr:ATP-binding cassette domain-containing protein [Salifodinibacter halophilus]NNC26485.1 ATP-binding cassette domain-containing protein [Salifodinibacter halophilus]